MTGQEQGAAPRKGGPQPGAGRPGIGGRVHVLLGPLLPRVDAYAEAQGVARTEGIRQLLEVALLDWEAEIAGAAITDGQIRELWARCAHANDVETGRVCEVALGVLPPGGPVYEEAGITAEIAAMTVEEARAECARVIAEDDAMAAGNERATGPRWKE